MENETTDFLHLFVARKKTLAVILSIALVGIFAFVYAKRINYFYHGVKIYSIGVSKADLLIIGHMQLPILTIEDGARPDQWIDATIQFNGKNSQTTPKSFCFREYEITYGYKNTRKFIENNEICNTSFESQKNIPDPEILTINAVDSMFLGTQGSIKHRIDCDKFDSKLWGIPRSKPINSMGVDCSNGNDEIFKFDCMYDKNLNLYLYDSREDCETYRRIATVMEDKNLKCLDKMPTKEKQKKIVSTFLRTSCSELGDDLNDPDLKKYCNCLSTETDTTPECKEVVYSKIKFEQELKSGYLKEQWEGTVESSKAIYFNYLKLFCEI